jgi:adenylyl-sulfate kinase
VNCGAGSGLVIWITGLSGAGKTTLATQIGRLLAAEGWPVQLLDGEQMRRRLAPDLGYARPDREAVLRRIAYVGELLAAHGVIVLVAAISPYSRLRREFRAASRHYLEIFASAPLSECERRDPKGLYSHARCGQMANFVGIDQDYEIDDEHDLEIKTGRDSIDFSLDQAMRFLHARLWPHVTPS